jgi:twitching motility protein PilU
MEHAIAFAETGHLVISTLHANNANQALDRIVNFFPDDRRDQLFMDLSMNLKAMLAQQLIPTPDGKGRRVAMEVLINTPLVSDMIRKAEVHKIKEVMKKSGQHGMKTFDQDLYDLYMNGDITYEDAVHHADSANEVRLMIKLGKGNPERFAQSMDGVSLMVDEE